MSSSAKAPTAARLRQTGQEPRQLEDLFGTLRWRQLPEVAPRSSPLDLAIGGPIAGSPFLLHRRRTATSLDGTYKKPLFHCKS
jgi:hypothetical protein